MDRDEILGWVADGYDLVCDRYDWDRDSWWPNEMGDQSKATLWALATFVTAAKARCVGADLVAACGMGDGASAKKKQALLSEHWESHTVHEKRGVQNTEILVDFSVHYPEAASPIQFTGESEMFMRHGVGDRMTTEDDYSWDFYKLLVVPSATRLFMARVGTLDGVSDVQRCGDLARSLRTIVDRFAVTYLRPHDEIGAFIFPSGKRIYQESWVAWSDRGRLRLEKASPWGS